MGEMEKVEKEKGGECRMAKGERKKTKNSAVELDPELFFGAGAFSGMSNSGIGSDTHKITCIYLGIYSII